MKTILTNCTVIDCTGKSPLENMTLIIEPDKAAKARIQDMTVYFAGDKISELKPGLYQEPAGEGERVFDLEGGYILPGLWNVHAHLGNLLPDPKYLLSGESVIDRAIRAGRNAIDALRAGITDIRVVGEHDFIDVYWKRAFDAGVFVGPRLFVCGKAICATGGPGSKGGDAVEIDGPYEIRKAVHANIYDVDQISLVIDGLLLDEVQAATEVAHQRSCPPVYPKGKRVCADARDADVKMAIQGGVDCIEHGGSLDDEAVEMMVEHDVFYVPTLVCTQDEELLRESGTAEMGLGDANRAVAGRMLIAGAEGDARERAKAHLEGFQKALKAGVKIACGGNFNPITEFTLLEIEHLVRAGMTEMEALIAATRTSAELCGAVDRLGTVEEGKLADLIVLSANPLEDISNIRKLKLAFKGGNLVEIKEPEGLADFWELFYF